MVLTDLIALTFAAADLMASEGFLLFALLAATEGFLTLVSAISEISGALISVIADSVIGSGDIQNNTFHLLKQIPHKRGIFYRTARQYTLFWLPNKSISRLNITFF
jgi:hypothetical protein